MTENLQAFTLPSSLRQCPVAESAFLSFSTVSQECVSHRGFILKFVNGKKGAQRSQKPMLAHFSKMLDSIERLQSFLGLTIGERGKTIPCSLGFQLLFISLLNPLVITAHSPVLVALLVVLTEFPPWSLSQGYGPTICLKKSPFASFKDTEGVPIQRR